MATFPLMKANRQPMTMADGRRPTNDPHAPLLERCARGERNALGELYDQSASNLFGLALRIVRDEAGAEECLQDAFVQIWKRADHFDPARGSGMSWMIAIVRYRALDHLRRHRHTQHHETDEGLQSLQDPEPGPWQQTQAADAQRIVRICLERLNDEQRRAVTLAYLEGLTHPELAHRLGKPLGTVKTWVRRGLRQLQTCVKAHETA